MNRRIKCSCGAMADIIPWCYRRLIKAGAIVDLYECKIRCNTCERVVHAGGFSEYENATGE